ncbi:MAG: PilZ domain-containing protein [Bradyrhizobium sp.]|nr:PilZ domain-containing protein [Bradyrhizobium sp.]
MATSSSNRRLPKRVGFEHGISALSIDGTWSVNGALMDISKSGAKLRIFGDISERLRSEEFFLLITRDGRVRRRARMVWEKNRAIGVQFLQSTASQEP